jgi:hypothetical protein
MPAQQMTPASGLDVDLVQARVEDSAEAMDGVDETFADVNIVRAGSEMADEDEDEDWGGGLRSRMEIFALWESRRIPVASPSPLEPPEMMKVRSWIFIVQER